MTTHTINGHPVTVGSEWRTRDGRKIGPMVLARDASTTSYMFSESIDDEGAWDECGDFGLTCLIGDHPLDLIAPWSEAPAQPPAPDYNDGNWHGWNGGECPVHPETVVQWVNTNGDSHKTKAGTLQFNDNLHPVCAFRVITPYAAPREGWAVHIYPTAREAKTAHPGGKPFRVVEVQE